MAKHLAIIHLPYIEAIFAGKKTVESRFSLKKIAPFGVVNTGDIVYMKPPGEEIIGQFRVKKVYNYQGLQPQDIEQLFKQFGKQISTGNSKTDQQFQDSKTNSRYLSLIFITEVEKLITSPIKIKKTDQRGWVVLS